MLLNSLPSFQSPAHSCILFKKHCGVTGIRKKKKSMLSLETAVEMFPS